MHVVLKFHPLYVIKTALFNHIAKIFITSQQWEFPTLRSFKGFDWLNCGRCNVLDWKAVHEIIF